MELAVSKQAELVCAMMDADGLDPDEFERTVTNLKRAGKRVKLLYTVPNFNNPTGALLSGSRRERIAATCRAEGILVVQDDAFADLSLRPKVPSSFWSIMQGQGVVVVGCGYRKCHPRASGRNLQQVGSGKNCHIHRYFLTLVNSLTNLPPEP